MEKYVLFQLGEQPVTLFSVCIAIAVAIGLWLMHREQKKQGLRADTTEIFALLALPLSLVFGRLIYCLCNFRLYIYELGLARVLHLWDGGYAMIGVVLGAYLAARITGRITRQSSLKILDMIAAPSAMILALCRFSEWASGQGFGREVEASFFQRFPFAVYNSDWEIWFWAVFMLEGAFAWITALVLQSRRIPSQPGSRIRLFLIIICAGQTFFEMLREDGYMRLEPWFIRITQLAAVLVLAGLMIAAYRQWKHTAKAQRISGEKMALHALIFLACCGIDIWMQFAIQKSADLPVWACYSVMALCSVGLGFAACKTVFSYRRKAAAIQ